MIYIDTRHNGRCNECKFVFQVKIYREYELHTNEEQEILSDALEESEVLIERLEY